MPDSKTSDGLRYACPKCGMEVSQRAFLCPNCREPLTGDSAPVPVRSEPKVKAPSPAVPETPVPPSGRVSRPRPFASPDEEQPSGPPLGRAVDDREGFFRRTLDSLEATWTSGRRGGKKPRTVILAAVFAGIGLILLARMLIVHSWAPSQPELPPAEDVSVLSDLASSPAPAPQAPGPAASSGAEPIANPAPPRAEQTVPSPPSKEVQTLLAAADQIDRLGQFLKPSADVAAPPRNPSGPEEVLPPIPQSKIPGPHSSREAKQEYAILLQLRDEAAMKVAHNLVRGRETEITGERAFTVANRLRAKARALGAGEEISQPAAPHYAAPGPPLTQQEIEDTIRVLLGTDDGNEVVRLLNR